MNAVMMLPARFSKDNSYPVLFEVYGGPASQTVYQEYDSDGFHLYLASHGYFSNKPRCLIFK